MDHQLQHTHAALHKHPLRKSNVGEFDCIKELEKLHTNRGSMSRHRQIQLMLQEFSIKKNLMKSQQQQSRGLSLPVIQNLHGCAPEGSQKNHFNSISLTNNTIHHQFANSTLDSSQIKNGIVPATNPTHESTSSMMILPSHKVNTQRANTSLLGVSGDSFVLQRRASDSKEILKHQVLNDGARIFATSKENLATIDEPGTVAGRSSKNLRAILARQQKNSEGKLPSNQQKRSQTSINVGQNIYKPKLTEKQTPIQNDHRTNKSIEIKQKPGTSTIQILKPFKQIQYGSNPVTEVRQQQFSTINPRNVGGSITDRELSNSAERQKTVPSGNALSNITKTSYSVNKDDLMRSSSQFKHLIHQFQKENLYLNPNSPVLETSSAIDSKFMTPGPGTYNVRGGFYKKERNSTSMQNRFKGAAIAGNHDISNFLTTSGNGTDRTQTVSGLNNTLNMTHANALTDFANSQMITNYDNNFGVSFKQMKQIYFKEYDLELVGKHSPGPAVYSPNMTFFKGNKHEAKSFTMQKRECPLVPKEELLKGDLSPMSYNLQDKNTAFEKLRSNIKYFGTKAKRRIDIRLFAQAHADSVRIGWH